MEAINDKFSIRKGKMDQNILVLSMNKEEEEYKKYFEKNYQNNKSFPPSLKNILPLEKFDSKKYYNEFHDKEYEEFIMKNNKSNLMKEFAKNANL